MSKPELPIMQLYPDQPAERQLFADPGERPERAESDTSVMDTYSKIYPISDEEVRGEVLASSPAERTLIRAAAHHAGQMALAKLEKPEHYPLYADQAPEHLRPVARQAILAASDLGEMYHWAPGDGDSGHMHLKTSEHQHVQAKTEDSLPAVERELTSK
jgi:hypothetical protein